MAQHNAKWQLASAARSADAFELTALLQATRKRTLALLQAYAAALGPSLTVAYHPQINPPLWELGHIGWFQEVWIGRNRQRARGVDCDPGHARSPSLFARADALYDSSQVEHRSRWQLALPSLDATCDYLQAVLDETLAALNELSAPRTPEAAQEDARLYFFRLALFHEDMHSEAAVYMAQALGIALDELAAPMPLLQPPAPATLQVPANRWQLGWAGMGFAFDNELRSTEIPIPAFEIDQRPVSWQQFLAFIDDGGYQNAHWWTLDGWQWLANRKAPRYLRRRNSRGEGSGWECQRLGVWQPLNAHAATVHISYFEAQAWCRWAGRSLPTEAQWEYAAMTQEHFEWGDVWEWTASAFLPYSGFVAHPYRDYSQPWFDGRPVLRGASAATAAHMVHPRYRNYFTPERTDIFAGFRSCCSA